MAYSGDEGRGKRRNCAGICKQDLIRTYPNGATHHVGDMIPPERRGKPGELKHLSTRRKRKKIDSLSSGERKGISLNRFRFGEGGVVGHFFIPKIKTESFWKIKP